MLLLKYDKDWNKENAKKMNFYCFLSLKMLRKIQLLSCGILSNRSKFSIIYLQLFTLKNLFYFFKMTNKIFKEERE